MQTMKRSYSATYRVVHWAMALCMVIILATIFLRMTWLNKEHLANIIQNYLYSTNANLSREEIVKLARELRSPMWQWHIYAGYAFGGVLFIRFALPFFKTMKFSNPFKKHMPLKIKFQYWVYIIFYCCLVIAQVSGLLMDVGAKELKKYVEPLHVAALYYVIPFLVLHIGGVLRAEFTNQPGVVSRIIGGKRKRAPKLKQNPNPKEYL